MNNPTCMQALPIPRKVKKKPVKNELDRIKQAEKKKRRLEKALATSAAIRAELEKKKQKKKEEQLELDKEEAATRQKAKDELDCIEQAEKQKLHLEKALGIRTELERKKQKRLEEQQRLDEEGAAIAEAVALHVLLGEDANDQCQIMFKDEKGFYPNVELFTGGRAECIPRHACCSSYTYVLGNSNWSLPYEPVRRDRYEPISDEGGWGHMGSLSADLIAAKAVSSLQISENSEGDVVFFNGIVQRMTF